MNKNEVIDEVVRKLSKSLDCFGGGDDFSITIDLFFGVLMKDGDKKEFKDVYSAISISEYGNFTHPIPPIL